MHHIILLSDRKHLPRGAFDFACEMNAQQPIALTGMFLPTEDYWRMLISPYPYGEGMAPVYYMPPEEVRTTEAMQQFSQLCQECGVPHHRIAEEDYHEIKDDLKTQTRFADLLLFSDESFHQHLGGDIPDEYTGDALHYSECPVMVVPENFQKPRRIVLAYDGSASSVFAIREFARLLPSLAHLDTIVVYMDADGERDIPYHGRIEDLAARLYGPTTFVKLDQGAQPFAEWMRGQEAPLLVTGSGGRSSLSELFRKSFLAEVLKGHVFPVFAAHR